MTAEMCHLFDAGHPNIPHGPSSAKSREHANKKPDQPELIGLSNYWSAAKSNRLRPSPFVAPFISPILIVVAGWRRVLAALGLDHYFIVIFRWTLIAASFLSVRS
jgi:hypothetical protein